MLAIIWSSIGNFYRPYVSLISRPFLDALFSLLLEGQQFKMALSILTPSVGTLTSKRLFSSQRTMKIW